jgi:hypothetical protein
LNQVGTVGGIVDYSKKKAESTEEIESLQGKMAELEYAGR